LDEQNNWVKGYKSECNPYHTKKILQALVEYKKPAANLSPYQIIHETFKLPIGLENFSIQQYDMDSKQNNQTEINNLYICNFTIYHGKLDALTNIQFICPNTKYHFKNIKMILCSKEPVEHTIDNKPIYGNKFESFELEFEETDYGYKISGLDNFLVIPTIFNTIINISIELNMPDYFVLNTNLNDLIQEIPDLSIKFDRILYDVEIRRNLTINKIDYEEFRIVDIIDYFKEQCIVNKQIINFQNNINIQNEQNQIFIPNHPNHQDLLYHEEIVSMGIEEQIQEQIQESKQLQTNTPINLTSYADFVSKYYTPLFYAELLIMAFVIPIIIYENYA
jgi:hypothetical protein